MGLGDGTEWEIGVAGRSEPGLVPPIERGYPMPEHAGHPGRQALARGPDGALWYATGQGLFRIAPDGSSPS